MSSLSAKSSGDSKQAIGGGGIASSAIFPATPLASPPSATGSDSGSASREDPATTAAAAARVAFSPRLEPLKGVFSGSGADGKQPLDVLGGGAAADAASSSGGSGGGAAVPPLSLTEYVKQRGGRHVLSKILIANNGIAALKAIRSIKKWSYETFGSDRVIQFVAMATPEDIKANAAYIHLADACVDVPGGSNNNNYANIELIADIAERCGAHAVWAGWGHASENPKLPELLAKTKSNVVWIGPPPSAMRALGDKIGSTLIAQSAGVSCMPWSGSGLTVAYAQSGLPADLYQKCCVRTADEALRSAEAIGYPVMIKASEGGGGKGIRKVERRDQVTLAFGQVQGEVPGSPIFLMKLAPRCRHLEVQLLADVYGDAIAIFGRDCSIQRRHQKIIEEGPVVAAPPAIWREMEKSAVALAKEVGYSGAGTVEYLYVPETKQYYFLELNPRLQVEHPVTELISGVNLPAAQLQVAMGIPLHCVRGVRAIYGERPDELTPIDFATRQAHTRPGVHVIACRVTAENPDAEFQPTSGVIQELNFRSTPDVSGYFSVGAKGNVHEFSDSQFGHIFATGETRDVARRNMVLALKELSIRGDIRTTVEYLRKVLENDDFRRNNLDTTWLERVMARAEVQTEKPETHLAVILGALWRAYRFTAVRTAEYVSCLERGQLPSPDLHTQLTSAGVLELIYENVKYVFRITKSGPNRFDLTSTTTPAAAAAAAAAVVPVAGGAAATAAIAAAGAAPQTVTADVHTLADDGILVFMDGKKHVVYGQEFPTGLRLTVDGRTCLFREEYDPTQLRATMAGKLVRFLVADGAHCDKKQPYAEIEVMKMYITLFAPEAGHIRLVRPEGSVLEAGDLLATLKLDDPGRVQKAELFRGSFPAMAEPTFVGDSPHALLKDALRQLDMCLGGYPLPPASLRRGIDRMMHALRHPGLPLSQFREAVSNLAGRIPEPLFADFQRVIGEYQTTISTGNRFYWEQPEPFPVLSLSDAIDNAAQQLPSDAARTALATSLAAGGITPLLQRYSDGANHTYAVHVITQLLNEYTRVESHFRNGRTPELVIKQLRKDHKADLSFVANVARAHHHLEQRNALVLSLLGIIESQLSPLLPEFLVALRNLSELTGKEYASVALKTRQLLMRQKLPSPQQRRIAIRTILNTVTPSAAHVVDGGERLARLGPLVDQSQPIEDLIFTFLFDAKNPVSVQTAALEVYVRRMYQMYSIPRCTVEHVAAHGMLLANFAFYMDDETASTTTAADRSGGDAAARRANGAAGGNGGSATTASAAAAAKPFDARLQSRIGKSISVADIAKLAGPAGADTGDDDTLPASLSPSSPQHAAPLSGKGRGSKGAAAAAPLLTRSGVMAFFKDFETAKRGFEHVLATFPKDERPFAEPVHVLYVGFRWVQKMPTDEHLSGHFRTFLKAHEKVLEAKGIRRVTFIATLKDEFPYYFTYRHRMDYNEDRIVRHIEPSLAPHMELHRLSNFNIRFVPTDNRTLHLFAAHPVPPSGADAKHYRPPKKGEYDGRRFFVRVLVRQVESLALTGGSTGSGSTGAAGAADPAKLDLDAHPETEYAFVEALNSLEVGIGRETGSQPGGGRQQLWKNNHVFINVMVESGHSERYVESVIRLLGRRYAEKTRRLQVAVVEFAINLKPPAGANGVAGPLRSLRFVCSNPTGHVLNIDVYEEKRDPKSGKIVFRTLSGAGTGAGRPGAWEGLEVSTPYPVLVEFQRQRQAAEAVDTVYVYDFLILFQKALAETWKRAARAAANGGDVLRRQRTGEADAKSASPTKQMFDSKEPSPTAAAASAAIAAAAAFFSPTAGSAATTTKPLMKAVELILDPALFSGKAPGAGESAFECFGALPAGVDGLLETNRPAGKNDVGMVAWRLTLHTPEYPEGRDLVLVANDITYQAGTFGPREDLLFALASRYARTRRIPRLYFAANSGARIGLAEEVKPKLRVAWTQNDPLKGHAYLYVDESDYQALTATGSIRATRVVGASATAPAHYQLTDVIGTKDGLGVENLSGSGLIAGETSLAYDEIFTLTFVTGRTVGIGSYLARLGQRCIQKQAPAPIILTGYSALNKLLGRPVYTSNGQLGGPDIMYSNGVTHVTVDDDMAGLVAVLDWLSFVPAVRGATVPVPPLRALVDPVDRHVTFRPGKAPYDPRALCAGTTNDSGQWLSGVFDRGSWMEVLGGWARSVVVGRARLGGVPVGVIAVETRTIEQVVPADPANPDSKEQVIARAGQVWYPDSAYKTAQAIRDLTAEDAPLFVFANWRGFSGGMTDMFDEVLKFGSYIVDALRAVTRPVFVYLPPHARLQGGAWVVVDSTINEQYMEMYADDDTRGGVLEPEGTVEVKFRKEEVLATAHRLDATLQTLDAELARVRAYLAAHNLPTVEQKRRDAERKRNAEEQGVQYTPDGAKSDAKAKTPPTSNNTHLPPSTAAAADAKPLATAATTAPAPARSEEQVLADIRAREKLLYPVYHQVATAFADLHDTPGRMTAKGVIQRVVPWEHSRAYFYWRMRRRLAECDAVRRLRDADPTTYGGAFGWKPALAAVRSWVVEPKATGAAAGAAALDDRAFVEALHKQSAVVEARVADAARAHAARVVRELVGRNPAGVASGLASVVSLLDPAAVATLKQALAALK